MPNAPREVTRFWDGQKYRFCPQCQEKAFQFAEAYAEYLAEAGRTSHAPKQSDQFKDRVRAPVNESRNIVREILFEVEVTGGTFAPTTLQLERMKAAVEKEATQ